MITAEEVIESLIRETGLRRYPNSTSNVLSKDEMKELLVFIVHTKKVNINLLQEIESLKKQNAELILKQDAAA